MPVDCDQEQVTPHLYLDIIVVLVNILFKQISVCCSCRISVRPIYASDRDDPVGCNSVWGGNSQFTGW